MVILRVNVLHLVRVWLASIVARRGKYSTLQVILSMLMLYSHSKAECTKPRVFKGPCRICSMEGHPAAECPDRPPDVCKNCQSEGMSVAVRRYIKVADKRCTRSQDYRVHRESQIRSERYP